MLFNWVQPLFNRYAQRCAKGVTRGHLWRLREVGFAVACVGGGIHVNWLVLAAACCVRGLVSGGGRGGGGVGVAGGLGVPVGRPGVACVRRAALAVLDWLWCRGVGGRRPHGRPGGAVVRM